MDMENNGDSERQGKGWKCGKIMRHHNNCLGIVWVAAPFCKCQLAWVGVRVCVYVRTCVYVYVYVYVCVCVCVCVRTRILMRILYILVL